MNLKFAKSGKTVIYKIIKMTIMSQKDLILNPKKLVKNCDFVATLAAEFSLDGRCARLSKLFGTHEEAPS